MECLKLKKADEDKQKAVKACRKYREMNKELRARIELLEENHEALVCTIAENDRAWNKLVEEYQYTVGQLKVYENLFGKIRIDGECEETETNTDVKG